MNLLTITAAVADLRSRGVILTDTAFRAHVAPLMLSRGDAQQVAVGAGSRSIILIDGATWWEWAAYLAARSQLIAAGYWAGNRAYSVADMEGISRDTWDWEGALEEARNAAQGGREGRL